MKEYKVYLNDLDYITLTDANNKLTDKGMIKSNILFYNKVKYEDLDKIRSEISWYLVNQKCLDKINDLQSKIDKGSMFLKEIREELKSGRYEDDRFYANEHIENINSTLEILGDKENE